MQTDIFAFLTYLHSHENCVRKMWFIYMNICTKFMRFLPSCCLFYLLPNHGKMTAVERFTNYLAKKSTMFATVHYSVCT